jgi:peptidyl-prolyl cis-trans isomerase A (cyclophilin A)
MTAKKSQRKRAAPVKKRSIFESNAVKIGIIVIFIAIVAIAAVYLILGSGEEDNEIEGNPIAVFDTTMGSFKVELFEDKLPITSGNFIKLVNDEFYNGMTFYRISDDFMIQAGRYFPDGSEKQSPYGRIEFETHDDVKHVDGAISMASTGAGVGGSAEFFICDGKQSFLDGNYAPFGVVIEGIEVVRNIAAQPHDNSNPAGGGVPLEDIIINSITIENL